MTFRRSLIAAVLASASLITPNPFGALAAEDQADPLAPISWAVGGKWVADIKTADGNPLNVTATFRWSGHKKAITYDVAFKTKDRSFSQYEGTYFWHPGKKEVVLVEVSAQGSVTEGVLKASGTKLVQENLNLQKDGKTQEQRVEIVRKGDDSFAFEAFVKTDGKWAKAVGFTYDRVK